MNKNTIRFLFKSIKSEKYIKSLQRNHQNRIQNQVIQSIFGSQNLKYA